MINLSLRKKKFAKALEESLEYDDKGDMVEMAKAYVRFFSSKIRRYMISMVRYADFNIEIGETDIKKP